MRWKRSFEGLDALVAERGDALLAAAVLLTGSRAAGEDLLQADGYKNSFRTTIELSGYGKPVEVTMPAAA